MGTDNTCILLSVVERAQHNNVVMPNKLFALYYVKICRMNFAIFLKIALQNSEWTFRTKTSLTRNECIQMNFQLIAVPLVNKGLR